jgi:DNA-binding CsgD family transcriptional regulator
VLPRVGGEGALLERDQELELLDGFVERVLAGGAVVALVEGPAGIGKSRLLAEARWKAGAAGFRVLVARGGVLERELPFGAVRQLFEPMVLDPAARGRWLAGSAAGAARVFEPPDDTDLRWDRSFGILHGLFWLTVNIAAEGPLCLSIDDLHWCDPASLRFVAYLERRLEGLGVWVATAARMDEPGVGSRLVWEIAQDRAAESIRPVALSEAAVGEMVRDRLGSDAERPFCTACHRATGGNPLLLGQLLTTMQAEGIRPDAQHVDAIGQIGPRAVSRTVLLRLARLPADAIAVARAVAVLGDGAALPATAAVAQVDEGRAADATHALVAAEILRPESPLGFVHPLVRDAVYHELPPSERQLHHERAAKELSALGAAPELVASHLLAVPSRGERWVGEALREAGLLAGRRGDAESAVAYLRRALQEPPPHRERTQLLLELGAAEAHVDAPAAAERMREAYDRLEDPLQRAFAAEVRALMLMFTRPPEAVRVVRGAVAELPANYVDERQALEAVELCAGQFGADVPDAAARLAGVRAAGVPGGLSGKLLCALAARDWAFRGGTAQECSALALEVLADGSLIEADPGFGTAVAGAVLVLAERDQASRLWDAAMTAAHRLGSQYAVNSINVWRGCMWLERGELAEAEAPLREMLEQGSENVPARAYAAALLARTLLERGDRAGARAVLAESGNPLPGSDGDELVRRSEIELLLEGSYWEQALAEVDECLARLRGVENPAWAPWRSLKALACDGLGRREEAVALLEQELIRARHWGAPGALGRTLRLLGTTRREQGRDLLREAVQMTERSSARLEHAKALIALGSAMRRTHQSAAARDPLRRGFELAARCGAQPLTEHARAELYAAGGRPRRAALSGPESLTPSERRVAHLAAEGHSNRDIAQKLYVTPRTVEFHLTSIYRKLGISRRAALPNALADPACDT